MGKGRTLGGIFVDLILRDEKFRAKMKAAAGVVAIQTARMRKSINAVGSSGALKIGAALGGAGLAAGIYKSVNAIDRLAKQADRLGIKTETLAAFRHAAGLAGVEVENMEKSVAKMSRNVFEASTGNENLANTFKKLGLNVGELMKMSPDKQFGLISDSINKLGNANERAAVAQEIFGKGGLELMSMIAGGSAAIADATREAELFGLTLDRVDAAKVEAANDAMGRIQAAGEGFMQQLTVKFAPIISEVGERIVKFIEKMGGMGKVAETVFNFIIKIAGKAGDVFRGWELIIAGLNVAWKGMQVAVTFVVGAIMTAIQDHLNVGVMVINKFIQAYNKLPIKQKAAELDKFTFAGVDATISATKDAVDDLAEAKKGFWEVVDKGLVSDTLPVLIGEIDSKWQGVAESAAAAAEAAKVFEDTTVTAADKTEKSIRKTEKAVKDLKGEFMSFQDIAAKGGRSFNARVAEQANKLRDKADTAEAKGQFGLADSLRKRAEDAEAKVRRRELDDKGREITPEMKAANEAEKAAQQTRKNMGKNAAPDIVATPNKPNTLAEVNTYKSLGIYDETKDADRNTPAKRIALDQAELIDKWANFDAQIQAQKDGLKATYGGGSGVATTEASGETAAESEARTSSGKGDTKEAGLLEKLDQLITLLIGLPKQIGAI